MPIDENRAIYGGIIFRDFYNADKRNQKCVHNEAIIQSIFHESIERIDWFESFFVIGNRTDRQIP